MPWEHRTDTGTRQRSGNAFWCDMADLYELLKQIEGGALMCTRTVKCSLPAYPKLQGLSHLIVGNYGTAWQESSSLPAFRARLSSPGYH
jgi:hypothetical protein